MAVLVQCGDDSIETFLERVVVVVVVSISFSSAHLVVGGGGDSLHKYCPSTTTNFPHILSTPLHPSLLPLLLVYRGYFLQI